MEYLCFERNIYLRLCDLDKLTKLQQVIKFQLPNCPVPCKEDDMCCLDGY